MNLPALLAERDALASQLAEVEGAYEEARDALDSQVAVRDQLEKRLAELAEKIEAAAAAAAAAKPEPFVHGGSHPIVATPYTLTLGGYDGAWHVRWGDGVTVWLKPGELAKHAYAKPGRYQISGFADTTPGDNNGRIGFPAMTVQAVLPEPKPAPTPPPSIVVKPAPLPAEDPRTGPGIYAADGERVGDLPDGIATPAIREALDRHRDLAVVLTPGAEVLLGNAGGSSNLWMTDRRLSIRTAGDDGERARLRIVEGDGWSNPIQLPHGAKGSLRLDGVELTAEDRPVTRGLFPVRWMGAGLVEIIDSVIRGGTNALDFGGAGAEIVVRDSTIRDACQPMRGTPGGGPSNGIFAADYASIDFERVVFSHNGWTEDWRDRTEPNGFSHGNYLRGTEANAERLRNVRVRGCVYVDNGGWGAQYRAGADVEDSLFIGNAYGASLPNGRFARNVIARATRVFPRDPSLPIPDWAHGYSQDGGTGLQVAHMAKGASLRWAHGELAVEQNVFADTAYPGSGRGPITFERGVEAGWLPGLSDADREAINVATAAARGKATRAGEPFDWQAHQRDLTAGVDFDAGGEFEVLGRKMTIRGRWKGAAKLTGNVSINWPHDGDGPLAGLRCIDDGRAAEFAEADSRFVDSALARARGRKMQVSHRLAAYRERAGVAE